QHRRSLLRRAPPLARAIRSDAGCTSELEHLLALAIYRFPDRPRAEYRRRHPRRRERQPRLQLIRILEGAAHQGVGVVGGRPGRARLMVPVRYVEYAFRRAPFCRAGERKSSLREIIYRGPERRLRT